jgi:hypothetical protein
MAVQTMLIDTLVARVSFALANDATPPSGMDPEIRWAIQHTISEMVNTANPGSFRVDGTLTTANGTSTYDLADDFSQMIDSSVKLSVSDFRTLRLIPEFQYNDWQLDRDQRSGTPEAYFVRAKSSSNGAWSIRLWPTPTSVLTVAYRYRAIPAKMYDSVSGDGAILDKRFQPELFAAVRSGAILRFPNYLSDADKLTHREQYEAGLEQMKGKAIPVVGQAYQRQPYTGVRRRGGGIAWSGNPLSGASG